MGPMIPKSQICWFSWVSNYMELQRSDIFVETPNDEI